MVTVSRNSCTLDLTIIKKKIKIAKILTLRGEESGVLDLDDAGDFSGLFFNGETLFGPFTDGGSLLLPQDVPVDGPFPWSPPLISDTSSSSERFQ